MELRVIQERISTLLKKKKKLEKLKKKLASVCRIHLAPPCNIKSRQQDMRDLLTMESLLDVMLFMNARSVDEQVLSTILCPH